MNTPNPATAITRVAVEFLTLWLAGDQAREEAVDHIARVLSDPDGSDVGAIVAGQLNLSMLLLLSLADERGAAGAERRQMAGDILREFASVLSE